MRFIAMHKTNPDTEAGALPSPELMAGMGKLMGEMAQTGMLIDGDGLRPSSTGVRLTFSGGNRTVTPGPFIGNNELLSGFTIVRAMSIDEAIAWADRFADIIGDVEIDVRPVVEIWDLGFGTKPEGAPTRFMIARKASASSEAGVPLTPGQKERIGALMEEMTSDGVLLSSVAIEPSSKGKRLTFSGGARRVTDGPFAESKELIAGFVMMDTDSIDDVVEWSTRFADVIGDVELDIRPVSDRDAVNAE